MRMEEHLGHQEVVHKDEAALAPDFLQVKSHQDNCEPGRREDGSLEAFRLQS